MTRPADQMFHPEPVDRTPPVPTPRGPSLPDTISHKIRPQHLDRLAAVYIRQSSPRQVLENRESTALQYNLARRAVAYGWPEDRVLTIDDDLGQSGRTAESRLGFQRLLAEVGLNHVGMILGLEMSRLARSCKDWYQLLELCAVFDVLLADQDGLYDPGDYNDRLLLGLKGTMSEAELHLLRGRMEQGLRNKALRGELFEGLPIGYAFGPSGEVTLDPDEQTRSLVRLIFEKFEELGTGGGVVHYFKRHRLRLPFRVQAGPNKGQVEWRAPSASTIFNVLHHPFYAGAYVRGRRQLDPRCRVAGKRNSGRTIRPMDQWQVLLRGRLPAYITWEQYLANQSRLAQNCSRPDTLGAPRKGPTLLGGLVRCGRCGWRMRIVYNNSRGRVRYHCPRQRDEADCTQCQSLPARVLDDLISRQVLKAVEPAALALSLQAAGDVERERERCHHQGHQELERATYQAERARRQYEAVDPENRLVARELERRWEEALRSQRDFQEGYDRLQIEQPRGLTPGERVSIEALAGDLPALWADSRTSAADRQAVIRCLVERVVVHVQGQTEVVEVTTHWAGGFVSRHEIRRPVGHYDRLRDCQRLKERLVALRHQGRTSREIAACLNAEGFRSPRGDGVFSESTVRMAVCRFGLSGPRLAPTDAAAVPGPDEYWMRDLARELKIPRSVLAKWCCRGWVHARKVMITRRRWVVWADADEKERFCRLHAAGRPGLSRRYPAELTTPKTRAES
jgi:DNA invertase Pin-like site-specific DNA recombinase